ncbi:MAG: POTRA domain-containing protein, partial [Rhodocyclaceae bacterium]
MASPMGGHPGSLTYSDLRGNIARLTCSPGLGKAFGVFTSSTCAALMLFSLSLFAADPLEVPIRPSERPLDSPAFLPKKAPDGFELPPVPELVPEAPTSGATIELREIAFEGNRVIPTEELLGIAKPFVGRHLTAAEIEELRHTITRHYIGKGYLNSGATIGEDAYRDGRLTVLIVEGRVEAVRLSGMERLRESYVRDRLSRGDEPLDVNVLQERF